MGVAVRRYIDIFIIIITFPYSTMWVISAKIKTKIFGRTFFWKGELHPSNIIFYHSNV